MWRNPGFPRELVYPLTFTAMQLKQEKVVRRLLLMSVSESLCPALSDSILWGMVASYHASLWMTLFYGEVGSILHADPWQESIAVCLPSITRGHHSDEWLFSYKNVPLISLSKYTGSMWPCRCIKILSGKPFLRTYHIQQSEEIFDTLMQTTLKKDT